MEGNTNRPGRVRGAQSLIATLLLAGIAFAAPAAALSAPASRETNPALPVTRTVWMDGLDNPWDLAFGPDGALFFTERCRGLSVRRADGTLRRLFGTTGAALAAPDLFCQGQSGMNGVAVDPGFAENRFIYVYMASNLDGEKTNRVVRLRVAPDNAGVGDRRDIVADIPFKRSANFWGGAGVHSGGRLRFGPDGFLYVTTGDNHDGPLPQDLARLGGKVLRIDRDGRAAPGNRPLPGGDPRLFTYGHRNVQGIAFRPGSGQPFACEHGPGHSDEVTPLSAGGNGGWDPRPETGVACIANYCGYTSNKRDGTRTPMTDLVKFPQALRPSWSNDGRSEGMSPCAFLAGPRWKGWEGRLAVGFLRGARIVVLELDASGRTVSAQTMAGLPEERIRALVPGPDGALYVSTDEGQIWRLAPAP
ncbi:MAG: PQQ-dependent sugar dehydrogenase [Deltaproteobacteria bacterium]|nr:PQQ-dependent sugar dehydrogenase [Deltaproteobacteria bacterium]